MSRFKFAILFTYLAVASSGCWARVGPDHPHGHEEHHEHEEVIVHDDHHDHHDHDHDHHDY